MFYLVPTVLAAVVVHQIFKRDENTDLSSLVTLLCAFPLVIFLTLGYKTPSPISYFCYIFLTFYTSLLLSIVVYRLSPWHPLARHPGPILCKVSKLYWAIITYSGQQHNLLASLHGRYGDIVRIGPNEVSISDSSAIEPLMGPSGLPKGQFWEGRAHPSTPVSNLVGLRDKKEHTRRRKVWARALTRTSIKYYENFFINRTIQLGDSLAEHTSEVVDIDKWIGYFAFDVMSDLVFGDGPEMMKNGDKDNLWHLLAGSQITLFSFGLVPWLGKLIFRASYLLPILPLGFKRYLDYASGRGIKRKQQGSPHKDLFYHLLDEDRTLENKPTDVEVLSDSSLAIIAGADTTSNALTSILYFLCEYPKVYERLQKEIDALSEEDMHDTYKQAQLHYLNAVISESLRLCSPVLSGSQREVPRGAGVVLIGSYPLPEGTAASIAFNLVHKDSRNFSPYPESFLPERWLTKEQREQLEPTIFNDRTTYRHNVNAFLAFSYGPAGCIGKQLACIEMRLVLCMLLKRFNLKFAPGYDARKYMEGFRDYYLTIKGALPLVLNVR